MTTSTHETEFILDPDLPLLRMIREFDAPPAKVFKAHTDRDLFAQWIGPLGMEIHFDHFDCRTGGSYRYVMTRDGEEFGFRGCFHDVRQPGLIVQTFTYEGEPDGVALERMVFEALGDGRTRLNATSLVDSFESRDAFISSGMEHGVVEGYKKLDDLLAR